MPGPLVDPRSLRHAIAREESRLLPLETELGHAQARLAKLKTTLAAPEEPVETSPPAPSTALEKVALFPSHFRGRDDIYPRFWSNARTGRKGYARMFEKRRRGYHAIGYDRNSGTPPRRELDDALETFDIRETSDGDE
jgi:hypothetical protein